MLTKIAIWISIAIVSGIFGAAIRPKKVNSFFYKSTCTVNTKHGGQFTYKASGLYTDFNWGLDEHAITDASITKPAGDAMIGDYKNLYNQLLKHGVPAEHMKTNWGYQNGKWVATIQFTDYADDINWVTTTN